MEKIYYDEDADLDIIKDLSVGIIGYGIQGRSHALNIRDSGIKVMVANRRDEYADQAEKDGFRVYSIEEMVQSSDIVLFLIPDQAQAEIHRKYIKENIRSNTMLVFAHGYTLRYQTVEILKNIDVTMLAPRMPGKQIRDHYLKGSGIPAFIDVVQNKSGVAKDRLLALAKAVGFTKAGVLEVGYREEAEIDLFVEQFLVASIIKAIHTSFDFLVKEQHFPAVPTLMELYATGELAEVLKMASKMGIGKAFQKNASPTCQFGIARNFSTVLESNPNQRAKRIIREIQDGTFTKALDKEGDADYPAVRELWETVNSKELTDAQKWINRNIKQEIE